MHAVRMSRIYLMWLSRKRGYQLHHLGMTLEDLAYDVVADLFSGEEEHCCRFIRQAIDASEASATGEEMLPAFQALLFSNVQQRIIRVFAEVHPLYHHLYNALRSHVRRSTDIVDRDMFDGRWYCLRSVEDARLDLPAIPETELRQAVRPPSGKTRSWVVAIFRSAMEHLDTQQIWRKAVLEDDVIRLTREIMSSELKNQTEEALEIEHSLDVANLSRVLHAAIEECKPWLEHRYIANKILSERDVALFLEAIRMYFMDLRKEGETKSTYWYLRQCMPGLTQKRYRETYHEKFRYILARILETAQERINAAEIGIPTRQ